MITMYVVVILSFLITALASTPPAFTFARVLAFTGFTVVIANPLINDYVENNDRGKATALKQLGQISGTIIGIDLVFEFCQSVSPTWQFYIYAILLFLNTVGLFFMIKEPVILNRA